MEVSTQKKPLSNCNRITLNRPKIVEVKVVNFDQEQDMFDEKIDQRDNNFQQNSDEMEKDLNEWPIDRNLNEMNNIIQQ